MFTKFLVNVYLPCNGLLINGLDVVVELDNNPVLESPNKLFDSCPPPSPPSPFIPSNSISVELFPKSLLLL